MIHQPETTASSSRGSKLLAVTFACLGLSCYGSSTGRRGRWEQGTEPTSSGAAVDFALVFKRKLLVAKMKSWLVSNIFKLVL